MNKRFNNLKIPEIQSYEVSLKNSSIISKQVKISKSLIKFIVIKPLIKHLQYAFTKLKRQSSHKHKIFFNLISFINKKNVVHAFMKLKQLECKYQVKRLEYFKKKKKAIFKKILQIKIKQMIKKNKKIGFQMLKQNKLISNKLIQLTNAIQRVYNKIETETKLIYAIKFIQYFNHRSYLQNKAIKTIIKWYKNKQKRSYNIGWSALIQYPSIILLKNKISKNSQFTYSKVRTTIELAGRKCMNDLKGDFEAHVNLKSQQLNQIKKKHKQQLQIKKQNLNELQNQILQLKDIEKQLTTKFENESFISSQKQKTISSENFIRMYQKILNTTLPLVNFNQVTSFLKIKSINSILKLNQFHTYQNNKLKSLINLYEKTYKLNFQTSAIYQIQVEKNASFRNVILLNMKQFLQRPSYLSKLTQRTKSLAQMIKSHALERDMIRKKIEQIQSSTTISTNIEKKTQRLKTN